jgi:L-glutamine-phosphate cytidylyltransferase
MKAVILAAGQGTRLLPFTRDNPKCLVEVEGKAILDHQLDALAASGIGEVVVVGGYRIDRLAAHLERLPAARRPRLLLNPFWKVANSIGSVWTAAGELDQPFLLMNGDTIVAPALLGHALAAVQPGVNLVVERARLFAQDDMRVAVAGGRVRAVGKDLDGGTYRSLGMILAAGDGPAAYRAALEAVIGADGGAQAYHHAIVDRLAAADQVAAIANDSPLWIEIDRPEDIERWRRR